MTDLILLLIFAGVSTALTLGGLAGALLVVLMLLNGAWKE